MTLFETVCVICFVVGVYVIVEYNFCTKLRNKCYQSKSSIDVFLTQIFDLIPNLVEIVKGYADYEKSTLERVAELRGQYVLTKEFKYSIELNSQVNNMLSIAENVPELKANEHFLNLQRQLVRCESQLQAARRTYNGDVTLYNTKIAQMPTNLVAPMLGFNPLELFTVEEYKKENIKVDL